MKDRFIDVIDYLDGLQSAIDNDELSNEEKLLVIIKYALLTDKYYAGSIIFTKDNDRYVVGSIQKHSYAWLIKGKTIDMDYIMNELTVLNITYSLVYYPISDHNSDYELTFEIPKLKKTRIYK